MLLILPEAILLVTALLVLTYDFIKIIPSRKPLLIISLAGAALSLTSVFLPFFIKTIFPAAYFSNFYLVDPLSISFKFLFLLIALLVILINYDFFASQVRKNGGEFYFLLLVSVLGLILMAGSSNWLLIYLGLEMVGLTSYLLAGWQKELSRSGEAALKYFLFGTTASAIFLYGVSLYYGLTGTFNLLHPVFLNPGSALPFMALLFILLGLGFKIAMFPMQFWCPDVYEGAPTPITAFLSVGPKAAGFAVLLRFLIMQRVELTFLFALLAVLTMSWGNLAALRQKNIKRLLAYSSIAQAGYIMMGLVSPDLGYAAIVFYLLVYTLANVGAFAAVIYLSLQLGSEDLESYAGFARRSPFLALSFAVFFLSLIGIPPLAGFVGKFLLFKAAIGSGYLWLAVAAVINSIISVYYYMNVMQVMYFREGETSAVKLPAFISIVVWLTLGATVILGVFPGLVL